MLEEIPRREAPGRHIVHACPGDEGTTGSTQAVASLAGASAKGTCGVVLTGDRAITVEADGGRSALAGAVTFGAGTIVGLADTVVTDHQITAVIVVAAAVIAPGVDAGLAGVAVGVDGAGISGRRFVEKAGVALAKMTIWTVGIFGALEVTEAADAVFANAALAIGDAEEVDHLALAIDADLTGAAVVRIGTAGVGGSIGGADTIEAGLAVATLSVLITGQAAPAAVADGAGRTLGVGLAEAIVDAGAVLTALAGCAVSCGGTLGGIIARGGRRIFRFSGVIGEACVVGFGGLTGGAMIGLWGRAARIGGTHRHAGAPPAHASRAVSVVFAAGAAGAVEAEGVATTSGMIRTLQLAGSVAADIAEAIAIVRALSRKAAPALMTILAGGAFCVGCALWDTKPVDAAELFCKAIAGVFTASRGVAESIHAAS